MRRMAEAKNVENEMAIKPFWLISELASPVLELIDTRPQLERACKSKNKTHEAATEPLLVTFTTQTSTIPSYSMP